MDKISNRPRPRRSEKLLPEEHEAFRLYAASFETQLDASLDLGYSTVTLSSVLLRGSGKPKTIADIRKKIKPFFKKANDETGSA